MAIQRQITRCSEQYTKWRDLTMKAHTVPEIKECLGRALFWLELQTAFMALWNIENTKGSDPMVKRQLITAKSKLSRRLADYANETLEEIDWK